MPLPTRDEQIHLIYGKMIAGVPWKRLENEAGFSRQWFDKERVRLKLPPVSEIRRIRRINASKPCVQEIFRQREKNGFYTLDEAAKELGITTGVLAVQRRKGKITAEKDGGRYWISPDEIERYRQESLRLRDDISKSLLTVHEVATRSGKSPATIYSDIKKKKLLSINKGSTILINESDFILWNNSIKSNNRVRIPDEEIIETYRLLLDGEEWQSLPLSNKMNPKSFDKRRSALRLPSLTVARKIKRGMKI